MSLTTFFYAKKYYVSDELEFDDSVNIVTGDSYKIPDDLINLLSDNLIVKNVGVFRGISIR